MGDVRVRTLTAEQSLRLLSARRAVPAGLPADLLLRHAAAHLGSILAATVAFAGWRDGRWQVLARGGAADLRLQLEDADTLDEMTGAPGGAVAVCTLGNATWTLARLPATHTAMLLIEGDWSASTHAIGEAARALCAQDGSSTSLSDVGLAAYELARDLAAITGLREVCELAVRAVVKTLP